MKITFMGAGACGLIGAAHCVALGHHVTLYELPEFFDMAIQVKDYGGIDIDASHGNGLPQGFVPLQRVTCDAEEALRETDIVFITVPSFGERRIAEVCAHKLTENQYVYLTSGYMYGSIEFKKTLIRMGHDKPVHIAEMNSTIYAGGRLDAISVRAGGYKHNIGVASFPGSETQNMVDKLRCIYPEVIPFTNVVETGISNPNAALHPTVVIFNASYVGCKEEVLLYHDKRFLAAMSKPIANIYESMDAERLILREYDAFKTLKPWRDIFKDWYSYFGAKGDTLLEIMSSNPALLRAKLPESFNHRYIKEDITAGLLPLIELLERYGVNCPTNKAVVHLSSVLSGLDLSEQGRTLKNLGLSDLSNEDLLNYLHHGFY